MDRYYKKRLIPLTLPAFILFIAVVFIPFVVGVLYSFTGWRGTYFNGGGAWYESFVGFENYAKVFSNKKFISALFYTVVFTLASVAVVNIISILMALLANSVKEGGGIYRTIYFVPNLLGGLALGYIWQFVFEIIFSKMLFGGSSFLQIPLFQNMLQDKWKAMLALVIVVTWQWAGYMMLIYTVGLNNISPEYIEAAKIDGASNWKIFWKIKVPLLMPSFTIALFQMLHAAGSERGIDGRKLWYEDVGDTDPSHYKRHTPAGLWPCPGSGSCFLCDYCGDFSDSG